MNKKNVGLGVGLTLLGCGAVIGAVCAKKYYTRRKRAIENYNVEVDRLQNEVDFDYSEDFLKELKKESLKPEKKSYNKEEVLKIVQDNKKAIKEHIEKLENVLNEYIKKEKKNTNENSEINEQMVMDGFENDSEDVGTIKIIEHVGPSASDEDFENMNED